ncbi:glycoside hydrolase family 108 protein [Pararhizobium haloflavum]|uniref:glycoside hydrolase family 108 protein n=1 Tax=Pararhizobium haloflavum TaxID=2037914 RepID=UPI001FE0AA44|nr:glycosyl hydrolase 108 family protein [Pararhizobium haloflavum]
MDRFSVCHPITAAWEGGWADHPDDPGGKTMYGVTEGTYHGWLKSRGEPPRPVRQITKAEALEIYRDNYWAPTAGRYNLVPGVDLATYDASVNSGVSRGVKWLKAAVGSNNHADTVKAICRKRLGFMQSLAIWKTFGRGWGNRVADIEAKGVKMALEAMAVSKASRKLILKGEAESAERDEKTAKTNAGASGTAGAASGGAAAGGETIDPSTFDPTTGWMLAVAAVFALIIAVHFIAKARAAKARKAAYQREARI